ncbi:MAG: hypothetical protein RJA10_4797 [Pseudomonadota bacterium]|jgi:tripartite-type tricarboxylate transporter receptor subunit TctC
MTHRRTALTLALLMLTTLGTSAVQAAGPTQSTPSTPAAVAFPTRPVTLIVPTPPGGASDISARLIARSLSSTWGQPVLVENRTGANGAIAAQAAMAAPADGYTLLWGLSSMAGLPFVQKAVPFRSLADLEPVGNAVQLGYALFASRDLPVQNFADLVAHGRANPGRLNVATGPLAEYGMALHVLGAVGVKAERVPYKGGAQLMPDLISGQVQLNFGPIINGLQHVRSGKIRVLATALPQRSPLLPDVPTFAELGLPPGGLPNWNAVFAPPGTPRAISERVAAAMAAALRDPAVFGPMVQNGVVPVGSTPQQLAEAVASATAAWKDFVSTHQIPQE